MKKRMRCFLAFLMSVHLSVFGIVKTGASSSSPTPPTPKASQGTILTYVSLSWGQSKGAQGYYVMRGTSKTFSQAVAIKKLVGVRTCSFKDTSAALGKKYYYWICPYKNGYYYYISSRCVQGWRKMLSSPTPTVSKGTYASYVKVSWSAVKDAQGYYIFRGTSKTFSKATSIKKMAGVNTKTFNDTSAAKNKKYYYWVCPYWSKYYFHTDSKCAQGWRKGATSTTTTKTTSYFISGSSSVAVGQYITFKFKKGDYLYLADWAESNSRLYLTSSRRGYSAKFLALTPGAVTVYAYYNRTWYAKTVTVTAPAYGGGSGISGPSSLSNSSTGTYTLTVGGKTITSGVSWSFSSSTLRKQGGGSGSIKLKPVYASRPMKKTTVISATYKGKKYQKTITTY